MFVYVNDGPAPASRRLFEREAKGDPRMRYLETATWAGDWGWTPRGAGVRHLLKSAIPPDYVVMWDDDDEIFPEALAAIEAELTRKGCPDALVVPAFRIHDDLMPDPAIGMHQLQAGGVVTLNLVSRLNVCASVLETLPAGGRMRGRDFLFFDQVRNNPELRIESAEMEPVGRNDGIRPVMNLRRRLGVPRLDIERLPVLRDIRWWLRG